MGRRDELLDREKKRHKAWYESLDEANGGVPVQHAARFLRGLVVIPTARGLELIEEAIKEGQPVRLPNYLVARVMMMRDALSRSKGKSYPATLVRIGHVAAKDGGYRLAETTDFDFRTRNLAEFSHFVTRNLDLAAGSVSSKEEWLERKERCGPEVCGTQHSAALPSMYLACLNELNEKISDLAANGFMDGQPLCPAYNEKHGQGKKIMLSKTPSFSLWSGFRLLGDWDEVLPDSIFHEATTDGVSKHSVTCPECKRHYELRSLESLREFEVFENGDFTYRCTCNRVNRCDLERDVTTAEPRTRVPNWMRRAMTKETPDGLPLRAPADMEVKLLMADGEDGEDPLRIFVCQLDEDHWFHLSLPPWVRLEPGKFKKGEVMCRVFEHSPIRFRDRWLSEENNSCHDLIGIKVGLSSSSLDQRWDTLRQLCDPIPDHVRRLRAQLWGQFRSTEKELKRLQDIDEVDRQKNWRFELDRTTRLFKLFRAKLDETAMSNPYFSMVQKAWFDLQGQIIEYDNELMVFYREDRVELTKGERKPDALIWQFDPSDYNRDVKALICQPVPTTPKDAATSAIGYLAAEYLEPMRFRLPGGPRKRKKSPDASKGKNKKKGRSRKKHKAAK